MRRIAGQEKSENVDSLKVLKVYTGQGAISKGMGMDVLEAYPQVRKLYNTAKEITGLDIERLCREGTEDEQKNTRNQQAMVYVNIAALILRTEGLLFDRKELWKCPEYEEMRDPRKSIYLGFSLGEILALLAAKRFSFIDGLKLIKMRSELMARENKGEMSNVFGADEKDLEKACREKGVYMSIINTDENIAIGGKGLASFCEELLSQNRIRKAIPNKKTSAAFHTPLFEEEGRILYEFLMEHSYIFIPSDETVLSNLDGKPFTGTTEDAIYRVSQQIFKTVQFRKAVKSVEDEIDDVIVIGPGAGSIEKIVKTNIPIMPVTTIEKLDSINKYWESQMKKIEHS